MFTYVCVYIYIYRERESEMCFPCAISAQHLLIAAQRHDLSMFITMKQCPGLSSPCFVLARGIFYGSMAVAHALGLIASNLVARENRPDLI